jgi:hypothetical protein
MLGIAAPFRARLSIHATAGMRVTMRHVRVWRVRRVLAIGIGRTRRRNGRIYRYFVVRIDQVGLMVTPIRLGQ